MANLDWAPERRCPMATIIITRGSADYQR